MYRLVLRSILALGFRSMGKGFAMIKSRKTTMETSEDIPPSRCVK